MKSQITQFLLIPLVLVIAACTPKKTLTEKLGGEEFPTGIFSNRAQNPTQFIAIIKLKSPALLSSTALEKGVRSVDADLLEQIEAEQVAAIEELKALSPEIKVLFRYRMVLNGMAILAPLSLQDKIKANMHVAYTEKESPFSRPIVLDAGISAANFNLADRNSVKFIGAEQLHTQTVVAADGTSSPITGRGMKVGIIDTGIDYTHAMFGGTGTEDAYKAVNPAQTFAGFPTAKVVGGIDLCGTVYDSGSGDYSKHIPQPDDNPLDEGGHGSHVAGTVAGIGDNVETYSGVAPEAALYAIKVFGADGSTGDAVVIAGLEYAADPNRDGELKDQLDVVNMSLGSPFGNPHVLYSEAVHNLVVGGTVVVASAGNSGPEDYIVGAPSTVEEAVSVAASVDDSYHNWKFDAVKFTTPTIGEKFAEAIEGSISKPVAEAGAVNGPLVFIGLADQDLTEDQALKLKGKVALIDRGTVTFADKIKRAFNAGAIGAIVVNNQDGAPISMGGDGNYAIPAVMIAKALGSALKADMANGDVVVSFQTPEKIEKPELIDTLTSFSSKGPRSGDGLMKPEISAPGSNVISAAMGKGNKGVKFSGTSMAGPHVAGVMALLKQGHPDLSPLELKSILMGHGKDIASEKKEAYRLSNQGAGRVQALDSYKALVLSDKTAFSLGEVIMEGQKTMIQTFSVKNISSAPLSLEFALNADKALSMDALAAVTLAPGESKQISVKFHLNTSTLKDTVSEVDGFVNVISQAQVVHRVPVLAVAKKISRIAGKDLTVHASEATAAGSLTDVQINNSGVNEGMVLPFNLLGMDQRKLNPTNDQAMTKACDLQAVGYRLIDKTVDNKKIKMLQVGIKIYEPMTTWNSCEVSVLLDANGDKIAEQELAAAALGNVKGLSSGANDNHISSVLLDAGKVRTLRAKFEEEAATPIPPGEDHTAKEENYSTALIDMQEGILFNHSTVLVVEADVTKLAVAASGKLSLKVATIFNDASATEMDDYLGNQWLTLSLNESAQGFQGLPETLALKAGEDNKLEFTKGEGKAPLLLLMPHNRPVTSGSGLDDQMQILKPAFQ